MSMLSTHMRRSWLVAGFFLTAIATSRSEPEPLRHEAIIDAPVDQVWAAFTTKAGLESWMAAKAEIELRVGGKMRTRYAADGTLGDAQTIENTILSFEPVRMISIRATKCPEGFPYAKAIQSMWSVVRFEDLGANRTRRNCHSERQRRISWGEPRTEAIRPIRTATVMERFEPGDPPRLGFRAR